MAGHDLINCEFWAAGIGDIHLRFTWQAWYLVTSTFTLPWQAWHLWHWAGSGGALGFRRGAADAAAVGVAGVALGDIHLRFTWQAWYLVTSTSTLPALMALDSWQPWHLETSTFVSRGRRGTW